MGIFDNFKRDKGENKVRQSTTSTPLTSVQSGYHFKTVDSGVSDLIYGVVQKLVNTVSMADLDYYNNGKRTTNSLTFRLKHNINPYQSFLEFMIFMETQRNLTGNAFAYILRDYTGTAVLGVYPLYPGDVETHRLNDGSLFYKLNFKHDNIPDLIHSDDMIHVKNISVNALYTNSKGSSPLKVLTATSDLDKEIVTASINKAKNDFANFMITDNTSTASEETQGFVKAMLDKYYYAKGGYIYNDFGIDIERLESVFNFSDLEISDKSILRRIATVYNTPITLVGAAYDYNGIEETNRFFIQSTIAPILKQYADQFTNKLLTLTDLKAGSFFTFDNLSLIQYDLQTLTDHYTKMFRSSMFTPNEVRNKFNMEPIEGGDDLWISGDMYHMNTPDNERNINKVITTKSEPKEPDIEGGD